MRILITAGPTREYLDDVRYLSNASSGRMGFAVAAAAVAAGHEVVLVAGPVALKPPEGCRVVNVETTEEMGRACVEAFGDCDGVVAAAAVCDYRPLCRHEGKLALEASNPREGALQKLRAKNCDAIVLNGLEAIGSEENSIELIDISGSVVASWDGSKSELARRLIEWIDQRWSGR